MTRDTGASLSCIDEILIPTVKRYVTSIKVLPEPQQLIVIGGHTLEGKALEMLWGTVRDQLGETRWIGLRVTLVPGLQKYVFSVEIGLADGLETLF